MFTPDANPALAAFFSTSSTLPPAAAVDAADNAAAPTPDVTAADAPVIPTEERIEDPIACPIPGTAIVATDKIIDVT
jgi:hypothetical protein